MTTNESTQKWTERNAAALALVDRLPVELQEIALINANCVSIYSTMINANKLIRAWLAEFEPDAKIDDKPGYGYGCGTRSCTATFSNGARLYWERKVKTIVVEDDQP